MYEGALQQAQSIYMRLSQRNTPDQYIKMLNDIVHIMNMVHAPRQELQLADLKTVTPEQQTTIDQLTKREEDALTKLSDIEKQAKKRAEQLHVKYPEGRVMAYPQ